jgi:hypothetical protein
MPAERAERFGLVNYLTEPGQAKAADTRPALQAACGPHDHSHPRTTRTGDLR